MKILTDDPDWKRDLYEARALAIKLVGRHGHTVQGGRQAVRNGLTVTYDTGRSPMQLTIDARGGRVYRMEARRRLADGNRNLSVRPLAIPAQGGGTSAPMA